ncbi:conjugal transfer protein TrbF [Synergistales bacterium]|nr:conjugal transfer protein TrbF [Synergistales bacterium]
MTGKHNEEARELANNPFLAGRTEAAERYGHLAKNAAQWRNISIGLLFCCLVCVVSAVFVASRVTVVPYIVQVDKHGYEIAVEPVASSKVDSRLMVAHVGRYIYSLRTVFADPEAQLHIMNFVYNSTPVNTSAEKKYKEFYAGNNPTVIGETETTQITVNSVLPLSGESWQAEWTEECYTLTGAKLSAKNYRGIFVTAVASPTEMREVLVNPLGIFITDFNLSELF